MASNHRAILNSGKDVEASGHHLIYGSVQAYALQD
jgi:hypothetical protein